MYKFPRISDAELKAILGSFLNPVVSAPTSRNYDVTYTKNSDATEYYLTGNFPGCNKTNVSIYIEGESMLVIESLNKTKPFKIVRYILDFEVKKVTLEDGILTVTLTKFVPEVKRLKIDIK